MLTLGLAGGLDPVHEEILDTPENYTYDGAAVLLEDGEVVAAIEQERLDRIKHSNKLPLQAARFCLDQHGITARDLDQIAYYVDEASANGLLSRLYLARPDVEQRVDARTLLAATLSRGFGCEIDSARLRFYQHKVTHAASALAQSGFSESLVFIIDNYGGLFLGRRENDGRIAFDELVSIPPAKSMGKFCQAVLPFLGLGMFDEYKAMALAPYGDAATYAPLLGRLYDLLPNGDYALHLERIGLLLGKIEPRRRSQEPGQAHKDLAASLQQAMEEIVLHVLRHHRPATGQRNLCLAGGMVGNSATNGKVLYSGLFDEVFVHPAAYDSGGALGAALLASSEANGGVRSGRVRHVYWGSDIGEEPRIAAELRHWRGFLDVERSSDVVSRTAELVAQGALVGWVQGRSEFGAQALGNRNVLADPRAIETRERVHAALERGEPYRPLALIVPEEDLGELFDLPAGVDALPFMVFAVKVRDDKRQLLGAATHVDGTARVQSLSRDTNPLLWNLVQKFKQLTGMPALLSASFNSGIEPTVESVEDAIASFLTTGLDHLVVGDFVAAKRIPTEEDRLSLLVSLPQYAKIFRIRGLSERERGSARDEIRTSFSPPVHRRLSRELGDLLLTLDGERPLGELLAASGDKARHEALTAELDDLWKRRLVVMRAPSERGQGTAA